MLSLCPPKKPLPLPMPEMPTKGGLPTGVDDAVNRCILAVAEDRVEGFHRRPFAAIAAVCGQPEDVVRARLLAMLQAGTIRRVRQTLLSTSLADGALIAWRVPAGKLEAAYAWMRDHDPFTGHVVLRESEDPAAPGADYCLWTTLKVPMGCGSVEEHCRLLCRLSGAEDFVPLPVVGMFTLGVGHVRRSQLRVGDRSPEPPAMQRPARPQLSEEEWAVLLSLKESLEPHEFVPEPWAGRAAALGMPHERYCALAEALDRRKVIGRFASFLDHQGKGRHAAGLGASGLFHWAVPEGMEERSGAECGRHLCMTHCYWRSGGEKHFGGAQIMGVVHAPTREGVLAHKAAIDAHLAACGIPLRHTAVFWSRRAVICPSEISPAAYREWWQQWGHEA